MTTWRGEELPPPPPHPPHPLQPLQPLHHARCARCCLQTGLRPTTTTTTAAAATATSPSHQHPSANAKDGRVGSMLAKMVNQRAEAGAPLQTASQVCSHLIISSRYTFAGLAY